MAKTGRNHKKGIRKTQRRNRTVKRGAGLFNSGTRNASSIPPHEVEGLYQAIQTGNRGLAEKMLRKNGVNPTSKNQTTPIAP
jgi:hypothetical protein